MKESFVSVSVSVRDERKKSLQGESDYEKKFVYLLVNVRSALMKMF